MEKILALHKTTKNMLDGLVFMQSGSPGKTKDFEKM